MFKSDLAKAFEKAKINVIIIIDDNLATVTAIVKKAADTKVVNDVFYRCLSVSIRTEIKIDNTLICNGSCFTEQKLNYFP